MIITSEDEGNWAYGGAKIDDDSENSNKKQK
jgi:hypothetical protein